MSYRESYIVGKESPARLGSVSDVLVDFIYFDICHYL